MIAVFNVQYVIPFTDTSSHASTSIGRPESGWDFIRILSRFIVSSRLMTLRFSFISSSWSSNDSNCVVVCFFTAVSSFGSSFSSISSSSASSLAVAVSIISCASLATMAFASSSSVVSCLSVSSSSGKSSSSSNVSRSTLK